MPRHGNFALLERPAKKDEESVPVIPGYADTGLIPLTWDEREKWLRARFGKLPEEVQAHEIELHRQAFFRESNTIVETARRREALNDAMQILPPDQRELIWKRLSRDFF
jgi:hypothetical protein